MLNIHFFGSKDPARDTQLLTVKSLTVYFCVSSAKEYSMMLDPRVTAVMMWLPPFLRKIRYSRHDSASHGLLMLALGLSRLSINYGDGVPCSRQSFDSSRM